MSVFAQNLESPAPTTRKADASAYDGKPIFGKGTRNGEAGQGPREESGAKELGKWVFSLAVVIGLIILMGYFSRKLMNPASRGGADAMTVLARQNISPRQQLMLVQVGRRVVMVGNSGGQMNALAEITDPDEIADVMNKCNRRKKAAAESFTDLFNGAKKDFEPTERETEVAKENGDAADSQLLKTKTELANLLEKVRGMSAQSKQSSGREQK